MKKLTKKRTIIISTLTISTLLVTTISSCAPIEKQLDKKYKNEFKYQANKKYANQQVVGLFVDQNNKEYKIKATADQNAIIVFNLTNFDNKLNLKFKKLLDDKQLETNAIFLNKNLLTSYYDQTNNQNIKIDLKDFNLAGQNIDLYYLDTLTQQEYKLTKKVSNSNLLIINGTDFMLGADYLLTKIKTSKQEIALTQANLKDRTIIKSIEFTSKGLELIVKLEKKYANQKIKAIFESKDQTVEIQSQAQSDGVVRFNSKAIKTQGSWILTKIFDTDNKLILQNDQLTLNQKLPINTSIKIESTNNSDHSMKFKLNLHLGLANRELLATFVDKNNNQYQKSAVVQADGSIFFDTKNLAIVNELALDHVEINNVNPQIIILENVSNLFNFKPVSLIDDQIVSVGYDQNGDKQLQAIVEQKYANRFAELVLSDNRNQYKIPGIVHKNGIANYSLNSLNEESEYSIRNINYTEPAIYKDKIESLTNNKTVDLLTSSETSSQTVKPMISNKKATANWISLQKEDKKIKFELYNSHLVKKLTNKNPKTTNGINYQLKLYANFVNQFNQTISLLIEYDEQLKALVVDGANIKDNGSWVLTSLKLVRLLSNEHINYEQTIYQNIALGSQILHISNKYHEDDSAFGFDQDGNLEIRIKKPSNYRSDHHPMLVLFDQNNIEHNINLNYINEDDQMIFNTVNLVNHQFYKAIKVVDQFDSAVVLVDQNQMHTQAKMGFKKPDFSLSTDQNGKPLMKFTNYNLVDKQIDFEVKEQDSGHIKQFDGIIKSDGVVELGSGFDKLINQYQIIKIADLYKKKIINANDFTNNELTFYKTKLGSLDKNILKIKTNEVNSKVLVGFENRKKLSYEIETTTDQDGWINLDLSSHNELNNQIYALKQVYSLKTQQILASIKDIDPKLNNIINPNDNQLNKILFTNLATLVDSSNNLTLSLNVKDDNLLTKNKIFRATFDVKIGNEKKLISVKSMVDQNQQTINFVLPKIDSNPIYQLKEIKLDEELNENNKQLKITIDPISLSKQIQYQQDRYSNGTVKDLGILINGFDQKLVIDLEQNQTLEFDQINVEFKVINPDLTFLEPFVINVPVKNNKAIVEIKVPHFKSNTLYQISNIYSSKDNVKKELRIKPGIKYLNFRSISYPVELSYDPNNSLIASSSAKISILLNQMLNIYESKPKIKANLRLIATNSDKLKQINRLVYGNVIRRDDKYYFEFDLNKIEANSTYLLDQFSLANVNNNYQLINKPIIFTNKQ